MPTLPEIAGFITALGGGAALTKGIDLWFKSRKENSNSQMSRLEKLEEKVEARDKQILELHGNRERLVETVRNQAQRLGELEQQVNILKGCQDELMTVREYCIQHGIDPDTGKKEA